VSEPTNIGDITPAKLPIVNIVAVTIATWLKPTPGNSIAIVRAAIMNMLNVAPKPITQIVTIMSFSNRNDPNANIGNISPDNISIGLRLPSLDCSSPLIGFATPAIRGITATSDAACSGVIPLVSL